MSNDLPAVSGRVASQVYTAWRPLAIVRVERIEIGDRGWRVVFRE